MNQYYKKTLLEEKTASRMVGWKDDRAQMIRFRQLFKLVDDVSKFEIADLGCGMGAFCDYLNEIGCKFRYTGYDLSEEMLELAGQTMRVSGASVLLSLISETKEIGSHEYIVASGIFNMKQNVDSSSWLEYVIEQLNIIDKKSSKGFAFNMLTSYSDKEFMRDDLYYADPCLLFDYCKKNYSRNVSLLHDYDEYDFTILVKK